MIKNLYFSKQSDRLASVGELEKVEEILGFKLPPTFHEFCLRWNGGYPSDLNDRYVVPPGYEDFYKLMYNDRKKSDAYLPIDYTLGVNEDFKQCNLLKEYRFYKCEQFGHFPVAVNLEGDRAVLRSDSPMGQVYWIDSDTWERPDGREGVDPRPVLMPIAPNLEVFYNALTSRPSSEK